jgi:hypothetical protein
MEWNRRRSAQGSASQPYFPQIRNKTKAADLSEQEMAAAFLAIFDLKVESHSLSDVVY